MQCVRRKTIAPVAGAIVMLALHAVGHHASADDVSDDATIHVVTGSFGAGGTLVSMQRQQPWDTVVLAELESPNARVQTFSGRIHVVEPETGQIRVFDDAGNELNPLSVGIESDPRDIFGVARNRAYVTRANATHLYRVDPQTGVGSDVVDLSIFADEDGIPDMERMISDGTRLFVQLRRLDNGIALTNGAIAIIDLETETLIDANPATPMMDAIELTGPAPRLRMHVDTDLNYLLVSATDGNHLMLNGGVEYINLKTLSSEGFVLAEADLAALGGFVMSGATEGYFLFHTDIIASNHLKTFTIEDGAGPEPEIVFDGGAYLDALLIDPDTGLLYMPASSGGMYVVDTTTNTQVTTKPIALPGFPVDMVIGPVGDVYDLTGDGIVNVSDLLALIGAWGDCPRPCPPTCLADIATSRGPGADCTVDVHDLLLLLTNWDS